YFPKGVSLANHPPTHLLAVEHELNRRPRKGPPRPLPRRAIHRTAGLKESVSVATLTRTHPVATGLDFNRRQHRAQGSEGPSDPGVNGAASRPDGPAHVRAPEMGER